MKENAFEIDYQEEQKNVAAYAAAQSSDETENAREAHDALLKKIKDKGESYCRLFHEYSQAKKSGNEYLDINDTVWDKDVENLVNCMRENGIEKFTFSSTWSSAVETAWLFTKCGCHLEGLVEINSQFKDFMTDEYEKTHGYLFRVD